MKRSKKILGVGINDADDSIVKIDDYVSQII